MTRISSALSLAAAALLVANAAFAQTTITPLATFGTNGWLAPGTTPSLGSVNTERGLAYNPLTGNLILASRAVSPQVRVIDGATGNDLYSLDMTGVTGGTFPINMVGVGDDGAIYVGNLTTTATSNFKVYKWTSEAPSVPPTVVYDALSGLPRTGDSFAVRGGAGASPVVFAAAGTSPTGFTQNSYFMTGPTDGSNLSTAFLSVPGTSTTANDFRLSLAWVNDTTLIGNQGGIARYTTINGTSASVAANIAFPTVAARALDYAVIGGVPCLAVLNSTTSEVSIYDLSIPGQPILLGSANATTPPLFGNTNATGSVTWGAIGGNTATLYAMNTNQGIQAFLVTIQPRASARRIGVGCGTPALALSTSGAPLLPSNETITVDNIAATTAVGVMIYGFTEIPGGQAIPVAPFCSIYTPPVATATFFPTGAQYQQPQPWPADPTLAGLSVYIQAATLDVANLVYLSNALWIYLEVF